MISYDNLSADDLSAIKTFRGMLGKDAEDLRDDLLYRFLVGRRDWKKEKYDFPASVEMLRNHLAWYAAKRPDQLLNQYNCPRFTEYYQCGYHGRDRFGCQVYYERPGAMKVSDMFSLYDDDDLMKFHALVIETGRRFYDRAYGGTGNGICVVMDLGGLSRAHLDRRVFDWISRASKIDAANYPEHLAHCFIVNAGFLTRTAWGVVKPMLDKRTAGKVEFLGGPESYLPRLRERIGDDLIPKLFGGSCTHCPNGCLNGVRFGLGDETAVGGAISKEEKKQREAKGLPLSGPMFLDLKTGGLGTAPNAVATKMAASLDGKPAIGHGAFLSSQRANPAPGATKSASGSMSASAAF